MQSEAPAGGAWAPATEILEGTHTLPRGQSGIVRDAVERLRADRGHTALSTAFLRETFTEAETRAVYEAVWGTGAEADRPILDPPNLHRSLNTVEPPIVERLPDKRAATGGRPAALYRPSSRVREAGPALRLSRPITPPREKVARRRVH